VETRQHIISGLEMTIAEAKRTTSLFDAEEWDSKRPVGWTPKEIYSHLGSLVAMVPAFADTFFKATEDEVLFENLNIDEINAAAASAGASKTPEQVMEEFETNYRKLIDFVNSFRDDQFEVKRRVGNIPLRSASDIFATSFMLHGLHHVYEAATP
jgi:hypothetical protein